jgi:hypothetical protein
MVHVYLRVYGMAPYHHGTSEYHIGTERCDVFRVLVFLVVFKRDNVVPIVPYHGTKRYHGTRVPWYVHRVPKTMVHVYLPEVP